MSDMTPGAGPPEPTEKFSTIPFSYRARLELDERVPTGENPNRARVFGDPAYQEHKTQSHHMNLTGRVHPIEYSVQEATALFAAKIQPLLDLGWRLRAVTVKAYDEKDV